ncbi:MAG TPA: hypothetical protein VFR87_00940 [Nocardioidaceae bacterium]|nr:hypothetical protein [Nocardioidaceae bacterium]
MARYRAAWLVGVVLFGALGTWAAIETLDVGGVLTILVLAACVGVSVALVPVSDGSVRPWRHAIRVGAVSGGVVVASAGLMSLFGAWGAVLAVTLVVFSPAVLTWVQGWYHRLELGTLEGGSTPHAPAGLKPAGPRSRGDMSDLEYGGGLTAVPGGEPPLSDQTWMAAEPASMDDAGLCLAWRKTDVALQRTWAPDRQLQIAQRRGQLLDELERRNASGFTAWLEAGTRAAGDPSRYFLTSGRSSRRDRRR